MNQSEAIEHFEQFIQKEHLRHSKQRINILRIFLASNEHLTAEQLYQRVVKKNPSVGQATIYRALKLFVAANLAREIRFENGIVRYEKQQAEGDHHEHLICIKCGALIEVCDKAFENVQLAIAKKHKFTLVDHKVEMLGICSNCNKKSRK